MHLVVRVDQDSYLYRAKFHSEGDKQDYHEEDQTEDRGNKCANGSQHDVSMALVAHERLLGLINLRKTGVRALWCLMLNAE